MTYTVVFVAFEQGAEHNNKETKKQAAAEEQHQDTLWLRYSGGD